MNGGNTDLSTSIHNTSVNNARKKSIETGITTDMSMSRSLFNRNGS